MQLQCNISKTSSNYSSGKRVPTIAQFIGMTVSAFLSIQFRETCLPHLTREKLKWRISWVILVELIRVVRRIDLISVLDYFMLKWIYSLPDVYLQEYDSESIEGTNAIDHHSFAITCMRRSSFRELQ